jgi:hypothetical protein
MVLAVDKIFKYLNQNNITSNPNQMAKHFGQGNLATTGNTIIVTNPALFCNYFLPDNKYTAVISLWLFLRI